MSKSTDVRIKRVAEVLKTIAAPLDYIGVQIDVSVGDDKIGDTNKFKKHLTQYIVGKFPNATVNVEVTNAENSQDVTVSGTNEQIAEKIENKIYVLMTQTFDDARIYGWW